MKKYVFISIYILLSFAVRAQLVWPPMNKPESLPTGLTPVTSFPHLQYFNALFGYNYKRIYTPTYPVQSETAVDMSNQGTAANIETEYLDGLGRPLQTVIRYGGDGMQDWLQTHVYDPNNGLEAYHYLPYGVNDPGSVGKLKDAPAAQIPAYYSQEYSGEQPFSQTVYDNSPLNRVTKYLPEGKNWVGSGRGTSIEYRADVQQVAKISDGSLPVFNGYYANGDLFVIKVTDEDGKSSYEYKDKLGRMVLTRKELLPSTTNYVPDNYLQTYYVYNEKGELRYVLSPQLVRTLTNNGVINWNFSSQLIAGLAYEYKYDGKGRLSEKILPGKGAEYYVYDKKDRLVLSQDAVLRASGYWHYTVYDCFDRPLFDGTYTTSSTKAAWISFFDNPGITGTNTLQDFLKDYNLYNRYPTVLNAEVNNIYYYDAYSSGNTFGTAHVSKLTGMGPYAISPVATNHTKGLPVASTSRILDGSTTNSWLTSTYFYDHDGNVIQVQSTNQLGGTDTMTNQYDFLGDLVSSVSSHSNPTATNQAFKYTRIVKTYQKDYVTNRIMSLTQRINDEIIDHTIFRLTYDKFNRVVAKTHESFTPINYNYNIRGWLTAISPEHFLNHSTSFGPFFGELISYDKGFKSKLYNGNIAGIKWKGYGAGTPERFYGYSYDYANRLFHAEFGQWESVTSMWSKATVDYTMSDVAYDYNGNLLEMSQRGSENTNPPFDMDKLIYQYDINSNKLLSVSDAGNNVSNLPDFKDGANLLTEYQYDNNGNLTYDANKGASYNYSPFLNKLTTVNVPGKGVINYVHDGKGNRLSKTITNNNGTTPATTTTYRYIGDFVYQGNDLQYISHEEGRCRPNLSGGQLSFNYDYYIKDHLDNVRSVVTAQPVSMKEYFASHEIAFAGPENALFDNIDEVREDSPTPVNGDTKAAMLDGNEPEKRIGTSIMLRVMAGDKFKVSVNGFYEGEMEGEDETVNNEDFASSLLATLMGSTTSTGVSVGDLPENVKVIEQAINNGSFAAAYEDLLVQKPLNPSIPAGTLNVLLFDEHYNLLTESSRVTQIEDDPGVWNEIGTGFDEVVVPHNGYLLVFMGNKSTSKTVWMDQLRLQIYKGALLEENHYYPFGLTLSTQPINPNEKNFIKYTSKELQRDEFTSANGNKTGIELYDYDARMMDPQLGLWLQMDILAEKYYSYSPYHYALDNPVNYNDPTGMEADVPGEKNNAKQQQACPSMSGGGSGGGSSLMGQIANTISSFFSNISIGSDGGGANTQPGANTITSTPNTGGAGGTDGGGSSGTPGGNSGNPIAGFADGAVNRLSDYWNTFTTKKGWINMAQDATNFMVTMRDNEASLNAAFNYVQNVGNLAASWHDMPGYQQGYFLGGASVDIAGGALVSGGLGIMGRLKTFTSTSVYGSSFGQKLFLSERFGITSKRFANSIVGIKGTWNNQGGLFKMGWSTQSKYGGGMQLRIGIGSKVGKPNQAWKHIYVPGTFVPNSFVNPSIQVKQSLFKLGQ